MNNEEKFVFDLQGYLIIKNVLNTDEVAELNKITDEMRQQIDHHNRIEDQRRPSLWGEPFKRLIDHPHIFPYLIELLGPNVRLDHDYSIFMNAGDGRGGLHGGPDFHGDHWYKYRDGVMRNGLCVATYCLSDVNAGSGGFACIPASHKTNFLKSVPADARRFERPAHYVVQPTARAGDVIFFTEALIHGTMRWRAEHERRSLLYKYSPGHSAWNEDYPDISWYGELTERQKRMLLRPSIGKRPRVVESE